ncbi:OB-fold nucleic acid binding domain-containing protein [Candidatus Undinarchaeota archaeon]
MEDLNTIIKQISVETGKKEAEIKSLIQKKQEDLSGLVSDIGAAHIVSTDLDVVLTSKPTEQSRFKIHDLVEGMSVVDVFARVKSVYEPRTFTKKDGEEGKIASLDIIDETGSSRLVLWDESASLIDKLQKNDIINIHSAYVRSSQNGLELHMGGRGYLDVNPEDSPKLPEVKEELSKISHLKPDQQSVDLIARLIQIYAINSFNRADGSEGKVATIILGDETNTVRCSCWGDLAEKVQKFSAGDTVKIENAYTKDGLKGVEIQLGWKGRISKAPKSSTLPPLNKFRQTSERAQIKSLLDGDENREIRSAIVEIYPGELVFSFCPKCNTKSDGKCSTCSMDPEPVVILNALLDDGTGQIRSVFYRSQAEKLLGLNAKQAQKLKADGKDLIEDAKKKLLGTEFLVSGNVKLNDYFGSLELTVREINQPNPIKEKEIIITRIQNPIPVITK